MMGAYTFRRIQSNQGIKVEKKFNRALGNQFWGSNLTPGSTLPASGVLESVGVNKA